MKIWEKHKSTIGNSVVKKFKLFGITFLRKEKTPFKKKINVLGVRFSCRRKGRDLSTSRKNPNIPPLKLTDYQILNDSSKKLVFPTFERVDVSIIIPVYNNYSYTKLCLASILEHTHGVNYEVIIADDASTDETKDITKEVDNIKVSRNETNLRFLKNCNVASHLATGKYILFLNNDTQVQEGWLSELVRVMSQDPSIGLVGSKLIYPDGSLQEAGGIIYSDASGSNYGRGDNPDWPRYNYIKEVDYISGASIMLQNDMWRELCGFDEQFSPAYYEDTDLAFRIRYEKNLKVVYVPTSVVVHFEGKSNGTDLSSGQKRYQVVNRSKFYQKWESQLHLYHVNRTSGQFLSKDRGQTKKNILVIDWKILTFDKDTGSRTTWQYMNLFQSFGFNVKLYPHDKSIEGQYLQRHLQQGIEVILSDFVSYISEYGKYFEYIYLNRPGIAACYIDHLRKYTNAKIIYQCHDLHYLRQYRNRLLQKERDSELLYKSEKRFEFDQFQKMDVVCSFSSDEVTEIKRENQFINAKQIPLYILDETLMEFYSYQANLRKNIMFVAGFRHAPNADAALWFVREVFPRIKAQNDRIKLYLVGSDPSDEVIAMRSDDIIVTGFVTEEELEDLYSKMKLVVCPLRSGAGVKGKIIEAIYHKVPVITTNIGIEGINNDDGLIDIANTAEDFADLVTRRYEDNCFLDTQSQKFASWIKKYFSQHSVRESLQEYLDFSNK